MSTPGTQLDRVESMLSDLLKQQAATAAPRWLDLRRASEYCCTSEKRLRQLIAAGKLRGYKLGEILSIDKASNRKLHVDRLELDRLFQGTNGSA